MTFTSVKRHRSRRAAYAKPWILLVGLLLLTASTYFLYLRIGESGVVLSRDAQTYLKVGMHLHDRGELTYLVYTAGEGLRELPLTHYPPLTSIAYALLMGAGVSAHNAPVVLSLLCWPLLLLGMTWLTWRLSRSGGLALAVMALASIARPLLWTYDFAWSEVLFLPLLVWLMGLLVDLPQREQGVVRRLAGASVLLALLMLTRYAGGFVLVAVGAWWGGWRLWQGRLWASWKEGAVLALSGVPLAGWLLHNKLTSGAAASTHFTGSTKSFSDGARAMVREGASLVWPSVRPRSISYGFGANTFENLPLGNVWGLLFMCAPLVVAAYGGWRYRRQLKRYFFRTPIEALLLVYMVLLYLLAQPFLDFAPISARDVTTALCVFHPWALGAFFAVPRLKRRLLVGGYVLANVYLLLALVFHQGRPPFLSFFPPKVESVAGQPAMRERYGQVPPWLMMLPYTSKAIARHHPALHRYLKTTDQAVIANERAYYMLAPYAGGVSSYPSGGGPRDGGVGGTAEEWYAHAGCQLPPGMGVVLFQWDRWREPTRTLEDKIDRQCPALAKDRFSHGVLYRNRDAAGLASHPFNSKRLEVSGF